MQGAVWQAQAMSKSEHSLSAVHLRPLRAGDIGWVISRHGTLYAQAYGWDMRFEALVGEVWEKALPCGLPLADGR